jgi:hypothetical protein
MLRSIRKRDKLIRPLSLIKKRLKMESLMANTRETEELSRKSFLLAPISKLKSSKILMQLEVRKMIE